MSIEEPPKINCFSELSSKFENIKLYVRFNPLSDHVYYFPNPFPEMRESPYKNIPSLGLFRKNPSENVVVAGSAALYYIQQIISGPPKWRPGDSDVFILGSENNQRFQMGAVDFVQAKEKTVEELLINFDFGCCRAAISPQLDIWVSAQCIYSILTHKFPMPEYMKCKETFKVYLERYRKNSTKPEAEEMMFKRFKDRIRKYSDRGFGVEWIDTTYPLPWIKNRFHYGEWCIENEITNDRKFDRILDALEFFYQFAKDEDNKLYFPEEMRAKINISTLGVIMDLFRHHSDEFLMNRKCRKLCDKIIDIYYKEGPLSENLLAQTLNIPNETRLYNCYECGAHPPRPESEMQKYDCSHCGGRKCYIHSLIDRNFKCDHCGQDKLCADCSSYARCCKDFINNEFVDKVKTQK